MTFGYAIPDMADVVLNNVVESDDSILTVGTAKDFDNRIRAMAIRIEADGSVDWTGVYGPAPSAPEVFGTQLNAVMAQNGLFIAAGGYASGDVAPRPWLLQLTSGSPDPLWQKAYTFTLLGLVSLSSVFNALLVNVPNRAVAGGDMPDQAPGPPVVSEQVPFLAVSELAAGTGAPSCSTETFALALKPMVTAAGPTPWMDRIPLVVTPWLPGSDEPLVGVDTLCASDQ